MNKVVRMIKRIFGVSEELHVAFRGFYTTCRAMRRPEICELVEMAHEGKGDELERVEKSYPELKQAVNLAKKVAAQ